MLRLAELTGNKALNLIQFFYEVYHLSSEALTELFKWKQDRK